MLVMSSLRDRRRGRIAALLVTAALAHPQLACAQPQGAGLVADLHAVFGKHHARAVHAKGTILQGRFTPAREASTLSNAAIFSGGSIPVTVRFSDFTGIPDIPDNIRDASPRGLGIRFHVSNGQQFDIVAHSFNGFPVANGRDFGLLLRAIAASGPGTAKPTPLDTIFERIPSAKTFLTQQKPPPESYATTPYFGVNAVGLTRPGGPRTVVRYQFVPAAGEHYLDDAAMKSKGANYLIEEVAARVAAAPIRFEWFAQLAGPDDNAADPSVAWPDNRKRVRLGTITIQRMGANDAAADKALAFMPGQLPTGIEVVDPMLNVRNEAYPISARERQ